MAASKLSLSQSSFNFSSSDSFLLNVSYPNYIYFSNGIVYSLKKPTLFTFFSSNASTNIKRSSAQSKSNSLCYTRLFQKEQIIILVCLDGTPPAYAYSEGFGDGSTNWLVFLETNKLTFRGGRIYNAVMEELLDKGMRNAQNAILTGMSAGGLSTILHCDRFRALFPNTIRVKCISDSGFFIRGRHFAQVIAANGLGALLPKSCTSKRDPSLCLFAEYLVEDVATPLFIVESAFDTYQIKSNFILTVPDFGPIFKKTLMKLDKSSSRGIFLDSCYLHTHILQRYNWMTSPVLQNRTVREAIGDWFYDRSTFQEIDSLNLYPQSCTPK
ncbi:hypothetical protein SASPL_137222 [Salvia splendens]|uniref:Pectin acetylesterase n=1 Tax=Salvia splendens TaxID=180675 RepID=A0A8X8ZCR6_SALSN|nr:hypothetical protein SASPL_137222 [Salvia splendens]